MDNRKFIPILIMSLFLANMVSAGNSRTVGESLDDPIIIISIDEAYYADLEGDGNEDDVYVGVNLDLIGATKYTFNYYIELVLPSGLSFQYAYAVDAWTSHIYFNNYFWNHALESGDYQVNVHIVLRTGGVGLTSESLIFDPPGGVPGVPPTFTLTY